MTTPTGPNVVEIRVVSKDMSAQGFDSATARAKKLAASVDGGADSAGAAVETLKKKTNSLGLAFADVGKIAGGILVADLIQRGAQKVKELVSSTISAASNLNESLNAVDKTFGNSAKIIHDWGNNNAAAFGLSTRAFNEAATPLGAMLKNFGFTADQVAEQTINLTKRAADMGSVFNVDVGETLVAVQAALRGETEPIRRFGVSINALTIEQKALAATGKTATSQLTMQDKATATLKEIMDQTATTQGDFADTSTGLANATRIATAEMENAKAVIGKEFLPVVAFGQNVLVGFARTVQTLPGPITITVAGIGALAASLLVLAPRIVATRAALLEMAESQSVMQRATAATIVGVGKMAAAFVALQIAGTVLNETVWKPLAANIDDTTRSLEKWDGKAKLAGEGARVFGDNADELTHALQTASASGFNKVLNDISITSASLVGLGGSFDQDTERVKAFDSSLAQLQANGEGARALSIIHDMADKMGVSVDTLINALPQYKAATEDATGPTQSLGAAAAAAATSFDDLDKSLKSIIDDAFAMGEAQDKVANDIERFTKQIKDQRDAGEKGAGTLDRNTQAGRDNAASVRDLVRDYEALAVKLAENNESTDGLKQKLMAQLTALGLNAQAAAEYVNQLDQVTASIDLIPKEIGITVKTNIQQALQQIHETDVEAHRANRGNRAGGITGAASGGQRGGRTWVGEDGPELVDLPYGSMVHSYGDSMRMASAGGGGGGNMHVTVGSDGSQLGDAIIWLIAQAVRAKGGRPDILGITNLPTATAS